MGRHKRVLPGPPGAFFFLRCRAGSFECGVFAFVSLGPECSRGGCHRCGVQLTLEFAHRFRGANIIAPRVDLSQSFVPKRGPDTHIHDGSLGVKKERKKNNIYLRLCSQP